MLSRLEALKPAYRTLQPKEFQQFLRNAVAYEERRMARPGNSTICGMGTKEKAADAPLFVNTYTWYTKRAAVHAAIRKFWSKRYAEATGVQLEPEAGAAAPAKQ